MSVTKPIPVKEKKPKGRPRLYTDEYYMVMAKEVVDQHLSFREAAAKYCCSHGTISHWTKLYREGTLERPVEKRAESQTQAEAQMQRQLRYIKELKAQLGELYLENQLLKKAQLYFPQNKREPSSIITSANFGQYQEDAE